jgi:hypothetical protein
MKLFDDFARSDSSPARYAEPEFQTLNRSARVEAGRVRKQMEEWFARYPDSDKFRLQTSLRSDIDAQHRAAVFELFLHELLLRLNCQVTIHPPVTTGSKVPDFLVESPTGECFYLEATLATGESKAETAAQARINEFIDALNRTVNSPRFFLWLDLDGAPATPPPVKQLATFLNQCLSELDPDAVTSLYESGGADAMPRWMFEHDGWQVEITPSPKKPEAYGRPGVRPIGAISRGFRVLKQHLAIRDAIIAKAARYGILDRPYVIAVCAPHFADNDDIMEALFGQTQYTYQVPEDPSIEPPPPQFSRARDGAWIDAGGPRYTRSSAVLLATHFSAWNVPRVGLRLYLHPWAQRPYQGALTRLTQFALDGSHMRRVEGDSIATLFDLDEKWPDNDDEHTHLF